MMNRNSDLNTDRLSDPRRRELPAGGTEAVGLAGFLGGGVWSIPAEELAAPLSSNILSDASSPSA